MKPLRLMMQAFGPYAKTQVIDFTLLGPRTMFVISGPTGAGKTTIFDGISYAIYGKASGDDRTGADLRSQFADDDITEVSLLFELRGKRYLVIRSPQQERKKVKQEGTTIQGAKAELYEIGDEQVILASNVREVDEKIQEIMGIDCHQFRQILMIPQGEFRKLLVSESKDKEKILQKLFHTENYKQIEVTLKDRASLLKREVENRIIERNSYINRIIAEDKLALREKLDREHIHIPELLLELQKSVADDENYLKTLTAKVDQHEEQRLLLQRDIDQGKSLLEQLQLKDQLQQEKQQLDAQIPDMNKKKEMIELAKKALILSQTEEQTIQLEQEIVVKKAELANAKEQISHLEVQLMEKQERLTMEQSNEGEREHVQKQINHFESLEQSVRSFSTLERQVLQLQKELEQLQERKQSYVLRQEQLQQKEQTYIQQINEASEAKIEYAQIQVKLNEQRTFLEKVSKLINEKKTLLKLEATFSHEEEERETANDELLKKLTSFEEVEVRWSKGQASILANSLQEEQPCPVCGSTHHPAKAETIHLLPTEEERKQLQNEIKQLEKNKQLKDEAYFQAKSQFESQMNMIVSLADEVAMKLSYKQKMLALEDIQDELVESCDLLNEKLVHLQKQGQKGEEIEKELGQIGEEQLKIKELLEESVNTIEEKQLLFVEKRRDLEHLSETVPEPLRNERALQEKIQQFIKMKQELEQALNNAVNDVQKVETEMASVKGSLHLLEKVIIELNEKQNTLNEKMNNQLEQFGFSSIAHFQQMKRSTSEIQQMEKAEQAFREQLRSVTDRYHDLTVKLTSIEAPNIEELEEKLQVVLKELSTLQEKRNHLYHVVKTNKEMFTLIEKISKEMAAVEEEYKIVGELANIASGKNAYKLTFERFVLAAFLDQILICANERLKKMTSGRYQLLRKTDRSKGNIQSGLELLIFDQFTGGTRHVKTLSGGESFKASLSLALGLADIVQSYSGGVSMETMFIDEGFGTLDPESLENAIETLMDIQSSGRLVGVISHVPELKERIECRFEVTPTQTGSIVTYQNQLGSY